MTIRWWYGNSAALAAIRGVGFGVLAGHGASVDATSANG
jgi:hypothetical protein